MVSATEKEIYLYYETLKKQKIKPLYILLPMLNSLKYRNSPFMFNLVLHEMNGDGNLLELLMEHKCPMTSNVLERIILSGKLQLVPKIITYNPLAWWAKFSNLVIQKYGFDFFIANVPKIFTIDDDPFINAFYNDSPSTIHTLLNWKIVSDGSFLNYLLVDNYFFVYKLYQEYFNFESPELFYSVLLIEDNSVRYNFLKHNNYIFNNPDNCTFIIERLINENFNYDKNLILLKKFLDFGGCVTPDSIIYTIHIENISFFTLLLKYSSTRISFDVLKEALYHTNSLHLTKFIQIAKKYKMYDNQINYEKFDEDFKPVTLEIMEKSPNVMCSICFVKNTLNDSVYTSCLHCFHKNCLMESFKQNNLHCPYCRTKNIYNLYDNVISK